MYIYSTHIYVYIINYAHPLNISSFIRLDLASDVHMARS